MDNSRSHTNQLTPDQQNAYRAYVQQCVRNNAYFEMPEEWLAQKNSAQTPDQRRAMLAQQVNELRARQGNGQR